MIEDKYIEQILDRADIVDVIGQFTELKKRGSNYEACCPLHKEKTPSFKVNPVRGTFHCYGCHKGGNAITFMMEHEAMSFPEAAKYLAQKYGIAIEEERATPEQEQKRMKRESMFVINAKCAELFVQNLQREDAKDAKLYIEKRWGKDYADEMQIGFAPNDWNVLCNFAKKASLSIDILLELGLIKESEKGKQYDFYRDRIIIPIRDRYRHIIGFTARRLSDNKEIPKYLNSSESEIYLKHNSIFGIDVAIRQAVKEDKFYGVEGAPDVMQMQRIYVNNTVAPLGTGWTKNHFELLKKYATRICFLPDADPPKENEKFGPGITSVMKSGLMAMQCGFSVSVKEIPMGEGQTKNDPDSFCTNKPKFDLLEEEDFITWYAKNIFQEAITTEEKSTAINSICQMVAMVKDDVKESMYLTKLQDLYKNKSLWTTAMNQAKKLIQAKKVLNDGKKIDRDLYGRYGFYEEYNSYYSITKDGQPWQWSNFAMTPMFHIKDSLLPKRLYKIKNQNKQEELIEMKQEDLVSLSKFKQKVEGLGNYIWLATEKELTKLKMFLYEQTETAVEITQLGWQRKGFFAFGNGAFDTEWHPVDEYGIVRLESGNYYLPASSKIYRDDVKLFQFERRFIHTTYSGVMLNEYAEKLIKVFGDNAKVGICFLLATLFRDIIVGYTKSFPILNLFGPKGSGKSELGHSLMSFFIIKNTPPNIQNATIAAMGDLVAQCANALVHIDEYKNTIDIDKREFLKGLWDGAGRSRMNMDRDKKREITSVDCGVILSGQEMTTIDIALFSRLVYLTFNKTEFSNDEKKAFDECKTIRDMGLSHLTLQLLRYRSKMETEFLSNYKQCMNDLNERLKNEKIEDRIQRNWVIPLAAFHTLEAVVDVPFSYKEMLDIIVTGVIRQNQECKSNNELANFWNVVSYLLQDGEIFNESDYRIEYMKKFKSNVIKNGIEYIGPRPILLMRRTRIFMLYKKFAKQVGDSALPIESLKYYLENSKEYMGIKNSVRFKNIQKGMEVTARMETIDGKEKFGKTTMVEQAMCFDYEMIMNAYNINLEVDTGIEDNSLDTEPEQSPESESQKKFNF
ncbi:DNA primase [Bacteroides ovatus]|uniref:DNA primase n=1 Tax=Bacteroides ovatus TaxID=28116 RepID=UPI00234E0CB2|nr:DNA primase [Bacteroides ovatus]MDC7147570.1 DNA primase [Bacteroides ovatus]